MPDAVFYGEHNVRSSTVISDKSVTQDNFFVSTQIALDRLYDKQRPRYMHTKGVFAERWSARKYMYIWQCQIRKSFKLVVFIDFSLSSWPLFTGFIV